MKSIRHKSTNGIVIILLLLLALQALGVVGCAQIRKFSSGVSSRLTGVGKSTKLQVIPLSNQDVAALSADDVVQVMRRAGFSDEQILQLGTDLRNGLLMSGAAQIRLKDKVEAIFAVHDEYVFITTRLRGSFIYDVKNSAFGLRAAAQGS